MNSGQWGVSGESDSQWVGGGLAEPGINSSQGNRRTDSSSEAYIPSGAKAHVVVAECMYGLRNLCAGA